MIQVGEVYLFTSPLTDTVQRVRVQRVSSNGQWADVVGEMRGVWMKHGWRARTSRLTPIPTEDIVTSMSEAELDGWLDSDQGLDEYLTESRR
jgi:hypothetical protein